MVRRQPGLDQDTTAFRPPASSARHLTQELKAALGRPEIRKVDSNVRVDDADERDVRKVESLRDHLRSEKNVHLSSGDAVEYTRVRPFSARGIEVHSRYSRRGKSLGQKPLYLLRSQTALLQIPAAAARTIGPRIFLVQAVVADETLGVPVVRERDAAVGTRRHRTAVDALHERRVTAPVEEQDALLPTSHGFDERVVERLAYHCSVIDPTLRHSGVIGCELAQIDHLDIRKLAAADSVRQREELELPACRIGPALQ